MKLITILHCTEQKYKGEAGWAEDYDSATVVLITCPYVGQLSQLSRTDANLPVQGVVN